MCGIIGYHPLAPAPEAAPQFGRLLLESRVRGRHACGLAHPGILARAFSPEPILKTFNPSKVAVAHTRYATSGDWRVLSNNQPLVLDHYALAFNGVIHQGTKAEFEAAFDVQCVADNDGEVFLRRIAGSDAAAFLASLTGSFAGVWLDGDTLYAGRNSRRPLWRCEAFGALWYASTRDIFLRAGFPEPTEVPIGVEVA